MRLLGDYSDLENLHVYGDLLKLYSLPVHGEIAEIANLFNRIRSLDDRILTVYVSYVLGRAGFYAQALASGDFPEKLHSHKFNDADWLENLILFEHVEEGFEEDWEMYFENEKIEAMKILFTTVFRSDVDPITGKSDEATHLLKRFDDSVPNYVIVHPRLPRKTKQAFMRTKEHVKQRVGEDVCLSTGQFIARFIPDEAKRSVVEANWEVLRNKILGTLQKEWPILVHSIHDKQLADIRARLRKARLTYEWGTDLENAIKDAGVCCEGLLQILHAIYPKKIEDKMEFNDLLCSLRDEIIEEFGDDIYNDLNLIREWRNKVLHPPVTRPDTQDALKVITKAELFHDLFHKKIRGVEIPKTENEE